MSTLEVNFAHVGCRLEFCRDRHDRQSWKFFPSCGIFYISISTKKDQDQNHLYWILRCFIINTKIVVTGLKIWSCKIFDKFQVWLYESLFFVFIKDIFSPPKPSSLCTSSPCLEYYPERKGVKNNCLRFTGIWWLNCQTRHFNLADGFLKHCSHMLSEKVHLMQLLFPLIELKLSWPKKNTTLKIWSFFIAVNLLLGRFHTNGDDSRHITNQDWENCSSKVAPPEKFLQSVSSEFGKCWDPRS